MTFMDSVRTCLREKYATFQGRASRSEYWWFYLAYILIVLVMGFILGGLFGATGAFGPGGEDLSVGAMILIAIGVVIYIALFIPFIAVTVRRFHDYNLSGWWVLAVFLLSMIPLVGIAAGIGMLVICCLKGTQGPNKFGNDPLGAGDAEIFS